MRVPLKHVRRILTICMDRLLRRIKALVSYTYLDKLRVSYVSKETTHKRLPRTKEGQADMTETWRGTDEQIAAGGNFGFLHVAREKAKSSTHENLRLPS